MNSPRVCTRVTAQAGQASRSVASISSASGAESSTCRRRSGAADVGSEFMGGKGSTGVGTRARCAARRGLVQHGPEHTDLLHRFDEALKVHRFHDVGEAVKQIGVFW